MDGLLIPMDVTVLTESLTATATPSVFIAISLSLLSVFVVAWKAIELKSKVRAARAMAEALRETLSAQKLWRVRENQEKEQTIERLDPVQESLGILSKIDLEGYLADAKTRHLIDTCLIDLAVELRTRYRKQQ